MEFRDLKAQYLHNKAAIDLAVGAALTNGQFIGGEPVKRLEEQLAEYVGAKHCITYANGTDALQLALMSWNIGAGDAVFVPDFTFFSTGEVVPVVNATPVFVDVEKDTFNISAESLDMAIQKVLDEGKLVPKVVIAVDLFGQPANYSEIRRITEKYNLLLLEDGAQGFGGTIGNQKACSFGDISTTSFFPAKPLGCYGDGGAVFTDNDEWAELIRSLAIHGKGDDKYDNIRIGVNSRLDTIQAAILLEKLCFFGRELEQCNRVADEYTRLLSGSVETPIVRTQMHSAWAQYTIRLKNEEQRNDIIRKFKEEEIPYGIYYKKPMHLQAAFSKGMCRYVDCKITEQICNTCFSLPMHAYLHDDEIKMVCDTIKKAIE